MVVIHNEDEIDFESVNNYILFTDEYIQFYLFNFKNVKTFGYFASEPYKKNSEIYGVISKWLTEFNIGRNSFLVQKNKRVVSKAYLKRILEDFTRSIYGVGFGVQVIRRLYETELQQSPEYGKMTLIDKKNIHRQLLHSFNTAMIYNTL
jgi:hypothetical protein